MDSNLFKHEPVLLEEILKHFPPSFSPFSKATVPKPALSPFVPAFFPKKWVLDATFGAGGHTKAILSRYSSVSVIALDRDVSAVKWGIEHIKPLFPKGALELLHANFHHYSDLMKNQFLKLLNGKGFDIIILDLGPSSPQLDRAERGFSFYKDGPLDMRMDNTNPFSAEDIINQWSEKELLDLFYTYGEIHNSSLVVKSLLRERKHKPIKSTKELSDLILKKHSWRKKGAHPARAYFLALRLKVNNELEGLKENLAKMIQSLNPGGRIFVLTFHSLEDRIVKNIFRKADMKEGKNLTKKVLIPKREEIKRNPRARSAKLRIFERKEY